MMPDGFTEIFEDEIYIVRYSGETPEIALHSSFYFLTRDKNGPLVELEPEHVKILQDAAVERFEDIVLRDVKPENIGTNIYRGIERTMVNYARYLNFCQRQNLLDVLHDSLARQLLQFFVYEHECLTIRNSDIHINSTYVELEEFLEEHFSENKQLKGVLADLKHELK